MKKVIVIGCAGSGKSYFSRSLAKRTGLPIYHLDLIWWRGDGTNIEREEFDRRLSEILERDKWIIDGNYQRTMERRFQMCDTVFFLDLPHNVCVEAIKARKGRARDDMAWQSPTEDDDAEFMGFIRNYNRDNRPRVLQLLEKYQDKNIIIFNTREQINDFLEGI